ncbi:peptide MFS transporter [Blastopirellula marina]|uniref:Proton/peptide symporter family protein n=1 Tax=Blastopirellula marina DSM 3645 TaxID=314230 RepID=A3ZY36_9BACT|nr:peptide MFS transporter [Blastopirellula marina]EAQ78498.1 proton/peptide symporter family protein [Blastopirellula marina DSM 3645]
MNPTNVEKEAPLIHDSPRSLDPPPSRELWGHPIGLYVLFMTEMWERFSFYGMRALLVFYLTKHFLFSDEVALGLYGSYVALGYATPVIGGMLADRYLGQRLSVIFGAILMCLGHFGMAFEGAAAHTVISPDGVASVVRDEAALQVFYLSLALLIVGIGFLKPNIATIVSQLYPADDPRRSSAYTLFQMGIMLGAALSAGVCGYLGETFGWAYGFGTAGVGMLIGLMVFLGGQRFLKGVAEPPPHADLKKRVLGPLNTLHVIGICSLAAIGLFWLFVQKTMIVGYLLGGFSLIVVTYVLVVSFFYCNRIERDRMLVLLAFQLALTFFATLFEQAGGSLNLFADRNVDRHFWGGEIQASQLQSIVPATIVLLAPLFAWLWPALSRINRNPPTPSKYAFTMVFMAAGFGVLAWATGAFSDHGSINMVWLVAAYICFGVADLIIVSVSYSTITSLSLPKIVGMMMGTSMLAISGANYLAAMFASWMALPQKGSNLAAIPIEETLVAYGTLFTWLASAAAICAVFLFLVTPLLSRKMHGAQ